jgi:hypothetical protein
MVTIKLWTVDCCRAGRRNGDSVGQTSAPSARLPTLPRVSRRSIDASNATRNDLNDTAADESNSRPRQQRGWQVVTARIPPCHRRVRTNRRRTPKTVDSRTYRDWPVDPVAASTDESVVKQRFRSVNVTETCACFSRLLSFLCIPLSSFCSVDDFRHLSAFGSLSAEGDSHSPRSVRSRAPTHPLHASRQPPTFQSF